MIKPQIIIGASGLIGGYILKTLIQSGVQASGTYRSQYLEGLFQLDIRNPDEVNRFFQLYEPAVVYLPAASANVDWCELHREEAYKTNVIGLSHVIHAINHVCAKLVYFSSDYVFDGKSGPYQEEDLPNPICEYGKQKLIAEHCIATQAHDFLIIRTTGVYGIELQKKNFIYRLVDFLKTNREIEVPVDQVGTPTYAPNLAQAVIELVKQDRSGLYHVSGSKVANRYEFATAAAKAFNLDYKLIKPELTSRLDQVAQRPLNGGLIAEKVSKELSFPLVDFLHGLQALAQGFIPVDDIEI